MANEKRVAGAVLAAAVRRIEASAMTREAKDAAIAAVRGPNKSDQLELSKRTRNELLKLVQAIGSVVVTGRKALKVFKMDSYKSAQKHSSANAKKHKPWEKRQKTQEPRELAGAAS